MSAITECVDVLLPLPEERAPAGLPRLCPHAGMIELRSIGHAADNGRLLFDGRDLRIEAGQRVGIVGPSGCREVQPLRLIQGLTPPLGGTAAGRTGSDQARTREARRRVWDWHGLEPAHGRRTRVAGFGF